MIKTKALVQFNIHDLTKVYPPPCLGLPMFLIVSLESLGNIYHHYGLDKKLCTNVKVLSMTGLIYATNLLPLYPH